jgi:cation diffusion facilitator family transporter
MNKSNDKNRSAQGGTASLIGIIANVFLAGCKIAIGAIFGVISVLADGLNNMMDCGNSVISAVSFKLSSRPADKEHPYGHERIEYVFSLVVAFLILFVAINTAKESVDKIINPTATVFSYWVVIALIFSVVVKLFLYVYYKSVANKINSDILRASAVDCLSDCISTTVVTISFFIGKFFGVDVDGYAGVLVALFIGWSAIGILKDIFSKLIGQAPDKQMIIEIKEKIKAHEGVLDVHDLSVYSYGPNKYFASAHIEVDAKTDVLTSHELIDDIEREFFNTTNIILTGHLDPVETDNPLVNELKQKVVDAVAELNADFSIHDFRVVCGKNHTNVLFDVAIPYETVMTKEEIVELVKQAVSDIDSKYVAVITVEYCI